MSLEHVHGPAFKAAYREAQRTVLDYAEEVAIGRSSGSLTAAALDRLTAAQKRLDKLRQAYIRGTALDAAES